MLSRNFNKGNRSRSIHTFGWYIRLYDRKVDEVMIRDLINVTLEEINTSAEKSVESDNTVVMYLHNNGDRSHRLSSKDIDVWLEEDIDD